MELIGYVTLEEANDYVLSHYTSASLERTNWFGCAEEDRAILLRVAWEVLDRGVYPGRKTHRDQPTAFPRAPHDSVPTVVKYAQIEQALHTADTEAVEDEQYYKDMMHKGITAYSVGNLSESYSAASALAQQGLCTKASELLRSMAGGGFGVGSHK